MYLTVFPCSSEHWNGLGKWVSTVQVPELKLVSTVHVPELRTVVRLALHCQQAERDQVVAERDIDRHAARRTELNTLAVVAVVAIVFAGMSY